MFQWKVFILLSEENLNHKSQDEELSVVDCGRISPARWHLHHFSSRQTSSSSESNNKQLIKDKTFTLRYLIHSKPFDVNSFKPVGKIKFLVKNSKRGWHTSTAVVHLSALSLINLYCAAQFSLSCQSSRKRHLITSGKKVLEHQYEQDYSFLCV